MFHAGAEAAIVLLLPTVRFFVDEDLYVRTLCPAHSLNGYLSTKPSQSHLQFNYTHPSISHTSPPLHTYLLAVSHNFLLASAAVLGNFFLIAPASYVTQLPARLQSSHILISFDFPPWKVGTESLRLCVEHTVTNPLLGSTLY